jgi:geranylgeranyl pyrophosphate synthase
MSSHTVSPSELSLRRILAPVAIDIARIDDTLRSVTTLEIPLLRHGVEAMIAAGGKRLRPAVLFMCAQFHDYDLDKLLPMAAAIELLHTASLVHDDTIDHALLRRGLPTLNTLIDEGTTVLVGDYLFAKSAVLSTMGGVLRATRIFAESLVTISEGEIEQKFATHHVNNSLDSYFKRIYAKTAVLFAAAGEIGAVLSRAPEDEVQRLRHYGRQLGMAFQVIDDILDLGASSEQLGKPTGGDLRQGTVTLPTMLYLESADARGRETVRRVIEGDRADDMVQDAIRLITSSDAVDQAHAAARRFSDEAKASLAGFPDIAARRSLLDLADFVVQRKY